MKKVKVNIFSDMKEALHDVAAHERGEVVNLRIYARSAAAEGNFSAGNSPHPEGSQRQPEAFRQPLERKLEGREQLGTRHASSAAGHAETFDDR